MANFVFKYETCLLVIVKG